MWGQEKHLILEQMRLHNESVCPDCGKEFFIELKYIVMLKDSFKINPQFPQINFNCGKKIIRKYNKKG